MKTRTICCKRVYDEYSADDGCRILVDRLWPRGVTRQKAHVDLWPREFTPSTRLRRWFHEDPDRANEFARLYLQELESQREVIVNTLASIDQPVITLVSAVRDIHSGHVPVLHRYLNQVFAEHANV